MTIIIIIETNLESNLLHPINQCLSDYIASKLVYSMNLSHFLL